MYLVLSLTADAQLATPKCFPDDLDTTSLGLTILKKSREIAIPILEEMLKCVASDGTFFVNVEKPIFEYSIN